MIDFSLSLIAFVIFVAVVGLVIYKDRKNVKREGIVLMRRTEKGKRG